MIVNDVFIDNQHVFTTVGNLGEFTYKRNYNEDIKRHIYNLFEDRDINSRSWLCVVDDTWRILTLSKLGGIVYMSDEGISYINGALEITSERHCQIHNFTKELGSVRDDVALKLVDIIHTMKTHSIEGVLYTEESKNEE